MANKEQSANKAADAARQRPHQDYSPDSGQFEGELPAGSVIQRARTDPGSLTARDMLQLQRTVGNRVLGRLLQNSSPSPADELKAPAPRPQNDAQLQRTMGDRALGATSNNGAARPPAPPILPTSPHPEGARIQRALLTPDPDLQELNLENASSAIAIHDDDEGNYVWRVEVNDDSYILKASSENATAEVAGTLLAGLLGVKVAKIALHTLNAAEVERLSEVSIDDELTDEARHSLPDLKEEEVLLMQDLSGTDLGSRPGEEAQNVADMPGFDRASFMRQLGQLAAADYVIGIGDRFDLPGVGNTSMVNFANIIYHEGGLYGIDYDVKQGLWSQEADVQGKFLDEVGRRFVNVEGIVTSVKDALAEKWPELAEGNENDEDIKAGVQLVVDKLIELDEGQLEALENEANELLEDYGTHVKTVIEKIKNRDAEEDKGVDWDELLAMVEGGSKEEESE